MSAPIATFRCPRCGATPPAEPATWRCPGCGGPLDADATPLDPSAALAGEGLWRYRSWLPVATPLTLGEPTTPLVRVGWGDRELVVKLEGALPTGSFKDRGAAVLVSWLAERGVRHVVEDSSGNAGAALAAYAARAGIACDIFVPADAPSAKLVQIEATGARTLGIAGPREAVTDAAIAAAAAGATYASHAWNPLYLVGTQTFAFELWEQLGRAVPDVVVVPTGGGALLLGAHLGFSALRAAGLADRVPRLVAAQADAVAPLVRAAEAGLAEPPPIEPGETAADGIRIARPVRGARILSALAETGGTAVGVREADLHAAHAGLARQGVLVERTSAVAVAAAARPGVAGPGETVVVAATGHGLKTGRPG